MHELLTRRLPRQGAGRSNSQPWGITAAANSSLPFQIQARRACKRTMANRHTALHRKQTTLNSLNPSPPVSHTTSPNLTSKFKGMQLRKTPQQNSAYEDFTCNHETMETETTHKTWIFDSKTKQNVAEVGPFSSDPEINLSTENICDKIVDATYRR